MSFILLFYLLSSSNKPRDRNTRRFSSVQYTRVLLLLVLDSDDQNKYETGDTCDASGWSLTNPDLRNYQYYVDSLEGFDEMLEREANKGRQSPVYNIWREASPNQNRRGTVQLQKNQDLPHQQGRSSFSERQRDERRRSLSSPQGQPLQPEVQDNNHNYRQPHDQVVRNERDIGEVQQEYITHWEHIGQSTHKNQTSRDTWNCNLHGEQTRDQRRDDHSDNARDNRRDIEQD